MYYIKSPSLSVGLASSEPSPCPSLFIPQWTNQMSILPCYKLFGRLQNFCKIQCASSVLLVKRKRERFRAKYRIYNEECWIRVFMQSPPVGPLHWVSQSLHLEHGRCLQSSAIWVTSQHSPGQSMNVRPSAFWVSLTGSVSLTDCINLATLASWLPTLQLFLSPPGPA